MRGKLPYVLVGVVVLLYGLLLATQPAPADWRPDYEGDSERPLGADVLRALLPHALASPGGPPARVTDVEDPPYLFLGEDRGTATYVFATHSFAPDEAEAARLLAHARRGATVVVLAQELGGPLGDSLGSRAPAKLGTPAALHVDWRGGVGTADDSTLWLTNAAAGRSGGYRFPFSVGERALLGLDTARTDVLATGAGGHAIVARVRVGQGAFVVASAPDAFSNAALMGSDGRPTDAPAFVVAVLAYVPVGPAFWDEHYKPRRLAGGSPLRYVLSRPPLELAYALVLLGVLAFIVFRGRRWQRPIPVVAPPPNAAVEFVRTLGRLYFQHGDHGALARRRTRYVLDRIRTRLGVPDPDLTAGTEARLVRRGLPPDLTADVFARLRRLAAEPAVAPADLVALDRALDRLFAAADGR